MHDAQLHASLRECRLNGFRRSCEHIHTHDVDMIHAAILQIRQVVPPEFRAFRFVQPQAVRGILKSVGEIPASWNQGVANNSEKCKHP